MTSVHPPRAPAGDPSRTACTSPHPPVMNDNQKTDNTKGFTIFVVVFILLLIGSLLFLALRSKREYDAQSAGYATSAAGTGQTAPGTASQAQ